MQPNRPYAPSSNANKCLQKAMRASLAEVERNAPMQTSRYSKQRCSLQRTKNYLDLPSTMNATLEGKRIAQAPSIEPPYFRSRRCVVITHINIHSIISPASSHRSGA